MPLGAIDHKQIVHCPLSEGIDTKAFDCEDFDLNDFLKNDALGYQNAHLAFTTCLYHNNDLIAYYSVMADSLSLSTTEKKTFRDNKRIREYPAIKIARLACRKDYKKKGIGKLITKVVKGFAVKLNDDGMAVRFITIDAYPKARGFYEKCGFVINQSGKENDNQASYVVFLNKRVTNSAFVQTTKKAQDVLNSFFKKIHKLFRWKWLETIQFDWLHSDNTISMRFDLYASRV